MALRAGYYGIKRKLKNKLEVIAAAWDGVFNATVLNESAVTNIPETATVDSETGNHLNRQGNIVTLNITLTGVTLPTYTTLFRIPEGYRPQGYIKEYISGHLIQISSAGNCVSQSSIEDETLCFNLSWVTKSSLSKSKNISDDNLKDEIVKDEIIKDTVVEKKTTTRKKSTAQAETSKEV